MVEVTDIKKEKINCIRNLWEKLNKMHYEDSVYFEDHYESFTFEKRIESIQKIDDENLKISIIKEGPRFFGYCISSIEHKNGEIDSIYIDDELRDRGYGRRLVNDQLGIRFTQVVFRRFCRWFLAPKRRRPSIQGLLRELAEPGGRTASLAGERTFG